MTIGTFRDQLIYPDSYADMYSKGYNDDDLRNILDTVCLIDPSSHKRDH